VLFSWGGENPWSRLKPCRKERQKEIWVGQESLFAPRLPCNGQSFPVEPQDILTAKVDFRLMTTMPIAPRSIEARTRESPAIEAHAFRMPSDQPMSSSTMTELSAR